ncbi:kinase-like domain-containing protein [Xylaria flabelliformis]|nr:kinase-like domain-containing protein [Xylaria flabelliformis]
MERSLFPSIRLEQLEHIGSGMWGSVYRIKDAKFVVKVPNDTGGHLFELEKKCFERLADNELIAHYLGVTRVTTGSMQKCGLLLQYYPLGTLREFLIQPASLMVRHSRKQQLLWTAQIIRAVIHIHSCAMIHGDIGIHNILVGENFDLKLTDFGGSSLDRTEMQVECRPQYHRPHSWRFPISGVDDLTETWKIPTKIADTFALGTVLYEVFTGTPLHKDVGYNEIRRYATRKEYPDLSIINMAEVRSVIAGCWDENYEDATQILKDLRSIWDETSAFNLCN